MRAFTLHAVLIIVAGMALLLGAAPGCSRIERVYYLHSGKYAQGVAALSKEYAQDPWNPELNYYLGRYHLALGASDLAAGYLKRATILAPDLAEYQYWLGMAYWAVGETAAEERAMERALALDPEHARARQALARNLLEQGRAPKALTHYDMILAATPADAEALWGRARALGQMGRKAEHKAALLNYLNAESEGARAAEAVDALNAAGDFSWRTHAVGRNRLALPAVEFAPGSETLTTRGQAAVDRVAREIQDDPALRIHVVSFVKGDQELAQRRALAVTEGLRLSCGDGAADRVMPSWIGQPQKLRLAGTTRDLDESVLFITKANEGA